MRAVRCRAYASSSGHRAFGIAGDKLRTGLPGYSIGIISSGDEIIPIEVAPRPGQVRDVNSYSLAAAVEEKGHKARIYPLVRDNAAELKAMVETSLAQTI